MNIKRSDIKHNFLRRIILRLDYNGIVDIKDTIKELQLILPSFGFVEMNSGFINKVEFEINDPIMIETQMTVPVKELQKTESFKFRTMGKDLVLEISKLFATLTISVEKYKKFEEYSTIFTDIVEHVKDKNPYLKPLRLGLRKINSCLITDKSKFNELFDENYFYDISKKLAQDGLSSYTVNSQLLDTFTDKEYFYNYIRVLSDAILNVNDVDKEAYQVALDIDGYSNDADSLTKVIKDKEKLISELVKINNTVFHLYANTLSEVFKQNLIKDKFELEYIVGVNKND